MNYRSGSKIWPQECFKEVVCFLRKLSINVIKFGLEAHSLCTGITAVFPPYSLRLIGT